ncbi:sensor histidine kinase [uncultured Amnibacterium sp.]|uniref:sensor histidine kinase n=1 Tax=uncultured Amnibacterium sp. TaxID=1631851 RepID=UPI0035C948EA
MTPMDDLLGSGARPSARLLGLVWLAPVVLATAAVLVTAHRLPVTVPLLVLALAPWVVQAAGRAIPTMLFALASLLPVVAILVVEGLNASVFFGTAALCLLTSRADRVWRVALAAAVGVALPFTSLLSPVPFDPGNIYFAIGDLVGVAMGVLLGYSGRLSAELRAADARLAAVRTQQERTALARDVHDLVAHSLTVVVLHISGSRLLLRTDPAKAEEALEQAERVCRESLDGIREVVGLLRTDGEPRSGSADLTRLAETYRAAGVDVVLAVDERTAELSLFLRGLLYRVAQESLANAARYRADGSTVEVTATIDVEAVTLRIANAVASRHGEGAGGYGLTGLREQVVTSGGRLSSGLVDGRWVVECRMPLRDTRARALVRTDA